ncbi:unnamed protein product [Rotaria magnacalcarata]|uniref:Uncharacterized protein n=1 Tax=Rotaria magnacalcarata TaxID=392030 RepID=A0A816YQA6_9BILA|nr:unnamed protein product [Rotaria magnacalcarata]
MRELGNSAHQTIEQLRRNVHVVRVFDQWDACIDFITALDEKDIVYLVIQAGYFKDELLFVLDSIHQIKSNRMSTTCYDDPTKDHSGPAASTAVPDNQMHFKACSFYLLNVRRRVKLFHRKFLVMHQTMIAKSLAIIHTAMVSRDIVDDVQMGEVVLQKNVRLGSAELRLLAIVGLQAIHLCDQPDVVVLSNDSGKIHDT